MSKKLQIMLRDSVEIEKEMLEVLESAGRNSGLVRQWLIEGFKSQNNTQIVDKPKKNNNPFSGHLSGG
ncbi:hypothetical protein [uncultured Vibrio sp.]|uniref:hypothetical protein n=1 Tax=uncultured Vibrio sp. TaxID=114054 RepID=UPI002639B61E|nr:hypothetical protein [uncultured Vibrio sp.]